MGKNLAVDEAVVGKIKRNMICSRSVVHVVGARHKCWINIKWSNDTTTEEKVEGVHKDGLAGKQMLIICVAGIGKISFSYFQ